MIARIVFLVIVAIVIGMAIKRLNKPPAQEVSPDNHKGDDNTKGKSLEPCSVCNVYVPKENPSRCDREDCPY